MKKIASVILLSAILFSCGSNKPTKPPAIKSDTSRVLGFFIDFEKKDIRFDLLWMIERDTLAFQFTDKDSSTLKKDWVKDTAFFVPKTFTDSAGKTSSVGVPVNFETVSIERNADSAIRKLSLWILTHPQFFKPVVDTSIKGGLNKAISPTPK